MRKIIVLFLLNIGWILFPVSVFALPKQEMIDLTIENKTRREITQIEIIDWDDSRVPADWDTYRVPDKMKIERLPRRIDNNASYAVKIKPNTLYYIVLIDTRGNRFAKRRQTWNEDEKEASVTINYTDFWRRSALDTPLSL